MAITFKKPALHWPKFSFVRIKSAQVLRITKKRPITSLVIALLLLLGLIAAGNFLFSPKVQTAEAGLQTKQVKIYTIGSVPKVTTQAQIQNSGVITIMAQSSGIVQSINVSEGENVKKGANLITLSSNYAGGNAPGIQQSIASKQLQLASETFNTQKEIIQKQRDVANATSTNFNQLRDISFQSIVDLRAIADLNQAMMDTARASLEANPGNFTAQQTLNQLQLAQNQIHQQILNTQHQTDPSKAPTELSNLQKDITLKQLDTQEKALQNTKEIASLQAALAAINASLLRPTAPFKATVQQVLVRPGEAVNPGTPLIILNGNKNEVTAVAKVPQKMAQQVSLTEDSVLHFGKTTLALKPNFVSDVATDGLLYSVIYTLPADYNLNLTDNDYITVEIPVGLPDTSSAIPFVPLDSIFQTQDHSYLYLNKNGVVEAKTVTTGEVVGSFVEIEDGLNSGDQVILNRNVIEGDRVEITQ